MSVSDDLRAVMEAHDGRSLVEMREAEPHYDVVVEKANYDGKGTSVTLDGSIGTYLPGREAKVGDVLTIWDGHNELLLGGERHGWALNGELIEWLTPFQRVAKRVQWLAAHDRKQRERMEAGAERRARDYDVLPQPFKDRLDRFANERADFWKDGGDYELFCCVEAAKIAGHLRPRVEAGEDPDTVVKEFYALPWNEQVKAGIDEGHSGNTFGGACSLARALLKGAAV